MTTLQSFHANEDRYVDLQDFRVEFLRNGVDVNMAVDGSITPVVFKYTVARDFDLLVHRLLFLMIDNAAMNADEFGAIAGGGLDNGILCYVKNDQDVIVRDLFEGIPIQRNGQFAAFAGVDVVNLIGNRGMGVRWTWSKATSGYPVKLPGGWSVNVEIRDDIDSILIFNSALQGILTDARD